MIKFFNKTLTFSNNNKFIIEGHPVKTIKLHTGNAQDTSHTAMALQEGLVARKILMS